MLLNFPHFLSDLNSNYTVIIMGLLQIKKHVLKFQKLFFYLKNVLKNGQAAAFIMRFVENYAVLDESRNQL